MWALTPKTQPQRFVLLTVRSVSSPLEEQATKNTIVRSPPHFQYLNDESEAKTEELYPQDQEQIGIEELLLQQKRKQSQKMEELFNYFEVWKMDEVQELAKTGVTQNFSGKDFVRPEEFPTIEWHQKQFVGDRGLSSAVKFSSSWDPCKFHCSKRGAQIKGVVIKPNRTFSLRTLGLNTKMIISLKGQSSFWIFNRIEKKVKPGDIIIKFQKEYNSKRIYLMFGTVVEIDRHKLEFRFFKRTELAIPLDNFRYSTFNSISNIRGDSDSDLAPSPRRNTPDSEDDYLSHFDDGIELKFELNDNGDKHISLQIYVQNSKQPTLFQTNLAIPSFQPCTLMLGGTGDSVTIRNLSIRTTHRMGEQIATNPQNAMLHKAECCRIL